MDTPHCQPQGSTGRVLQPEDPLLAFLDSMPLRYREQFDAVTATRHARVVAERGLRATSIGLFPSPHREGMGLCIVASDEPGLLALISAALVLCGLDVIEAEAYTRVTHGGNIEAVDLFWVRHLYPDHEEEVTERDARAVREALMELLAGRYGQATAPQRSPGSLTPGASETSVRFIEGSQGNIVTLEVETRDRSGLLLAVTQALFREQVQIVGSHIATRGGRVYDRFEILELDGSPIGNAHRHALQLAVLAAIDNGGTASVASSCG